MPDPKLYADKIKRKESESDLMQYAGGNQPFIKPLFQPHFKPMLQSINAGVKAKSRISQPEDASEMQADEMADSFTDGDAHYNGDVPAQNASEVSAKTNGEAMCTSEEFDQELMEIMDGGMPLPAEKREQLEEFTGVDLENVRLHTDHAAKKISDSINARAFTFGNDIFFSDSFTDEELLVHEVAHVVQNNNGAHDEIQRKATPPGHPPVQEGNLFEGITYVIDGDGDQLKELTLTFKRDSQKHEDDECDLYVMDNNAFEEQGPFVLKIPGIDWTTFYLAQIEGTNGLRPTEIELLDIKFYNSRQQVPADRKLLVYPPKQQAEQGKYKIVHGTQVIDLVFTDTVIQTSNVMNVDTESKTKTGFPSIEFIAGFYKDRFRLILEPDPELQEKTTNSLYAYKLLFAGINEGGSGYAFSKLQFYLKKPIEQASFNLTGSGITYLSFDVDGDKINDLTIYTSMIQTFAMPDIHAEDDRKIEFMLYGPSFQKDGKQLSFNKVGGKFQYKSTWDIESFYDKTAVKVPEDLAAVPMFNSIETDLGILNGQLEMAYKEAEPLKAVDAANFTAWQQLSAKMFQLLYVVARDPVQSAEHDKFITDTAALASTFYEGFRKEVGSTGDELSGGKYAKTGTNKYTKASKTSTFAGGSETPLHIVANIKAKDWQKTRTDFFKLSAGYNLWIADKIAEKDPTKKELASRIGETSAQLGKLAELYGDENVTLLTRVKSVYYSYTPIGGKGSTTGYPLPLYFYFNKKDHEWVIIDLVHSENPFQVSKSVDASVVPKAGDEPPVELFQELDHSDHLPEGILYFQLASGVNGSVKLTEPWSASDILGAVGIGLAAIGFSILTFGEGTPLAAAWASAFFYASTAASMASAVADIYDAMEHGQASLTRILLDVLDIATSLLQIKLTTLGSVVAAKGISTLTNFERGVYFALKVGTTGLEGVQLAIIGYDSWTKIQEIMDGPGKPEDKSKAIAMLMSQFLITGAFWVLDLKGSKAEKDFGPDVTENKKPIKLYEYTDEGTGMRIRMAFSEMDIDINDAWFIRSAKALRTAKLSPTQVVGISEEAMLHMKTTDLHLQNGQMDKAIASFDEFKAKTNGLDITAEQFELIEGSLAEQNGTTNPKIYRNKEASFNEYSGTTKTFSDVLKTKKAGTFGTKSSPLYHGTDFQTLKEETGLDVDINTPEGKQAIIDHIFANGLPSRGSNTNLSQHSMAHRDEMGNKDSAFRGTTEYFVSQDRDAGAAFWAGNDENGIVIEISDVPGWDLNSTIGDSNPVHGENEIVILAGVPNNKIVGIKYVRSNYKPGKEIKNPNYK